MPATTAAPKSVATKNVAAKRVASKKAATKEAGARTLLAGQPSLAKKAARPGSRA